MIPYMVRGKGNQIARPKLIYDPITMRFVKYVIRKLLKFKFSIQNSTHLPR